MRVTYHDKDYIRTDGAWYNADDSSQIDDQELIMELGELASASSGESKADKFKRLGKYRVTKAVERIEQIGHLANKSQYEYTEEQINRIEALLESTLRATLGKFKARSTEKSVIEL